MDWTEINVTVSGRDSDTAAAIANMTVPYGIYIEDYSDLEEQAVNIAHIDLIDEELLEKDRSKAVIHIYISKTDNAAEALEFLKERLTAAGIEYKCDTVGVNDTEWNENWKKYFKSTEIGNRLAIVPSWEKYENKQNRKILHIDPGAAFGTGTHATTSLCLEMLDSHIKDGMTVLDIGCGSGILAVASVILGAKSAVGVDIDAQSVKTARENAEINGITDRTEFLVGDLADKVSGKYDVICANIVADVVIRLMDGVKEYMNDDTLFIVSGIIDMREQDVLNAAKERGFNVVEAHTRDNWRAYLLMGGK